jgi:hypothetical protein
MMKEFARNKTVLPSGAARATASVAIRVPAPGRFSTTTEVLRSRPIWSAIKRATMSTPPPGGNGTTILMVRVA